MKNRILFIIMAVGITLFSACTDEVREALFEGPAKADSIVLYTITAGSHYATQSSFQPLSNVSVLKFRTRFDSSAIYQTTLSENQGDINKLFGMSDCNSDHQMNSARFGWRWFDGKLEIWAYAYVNGERKIAFIQSVSIGSTDLYQLTFTDSSYLFKVNDAVVSIPRPCSDPANGYRLYPYFGGDEVAPHRITIEIEEF